MRSVVELQSLCVGYGKRQIVRDIDATLEEGESLLVIGHNGAGKTTLIRTLFGLQPKLGGNVNLLEQMVVSGYAAQLIRSGVRFLGQGLRYFGGLTVREHRRVLCRLYGFDPEMEMHKTSTYGLRTRVQRLSVGQRRLEALRMLDVGNPRLFLLDEPTAGIDIGQSGLILDWISETRRRGVSFVVVEHNFERMLELCDKTMVIRAGTVTYFGPSEPLRDEVTLAKYFL